MALEENGSGGNSLNSKIIDLFNITQEMKLSFFNDFLCNILLNNPLQYNIYYLFLIPEPQTRMLRFFHEFVFCLYCSK